MTIVSNLPEMTVEEAESFTVRIRESMRALQDSSNEGEAMRRNHPVEFAAVMAERSPLPQSPIEQPHYSTFSSVVYFIQAGEGGPIKIGYASNFSKRLAALQTGCPVELSVLGMMPGGPREESELHVRLRWHRTRGEWFAPTDAVLRAIAEVSV